MSIKEDAHAIIDQLPEDAHWDDLVKTLYKQKKITIGMTDLEVVQHDLSDAEINGIMGRLQSSSSQPSDMRNTKSYEPGNASTLGMIAGIVALLFGFIFPPIAWIAAPIAIIAGLVGVKNKEEKAWVPILLAIISIAPIAVILSEKGII